MKLYYQLSAALVGTAIVTLQPLMVVSQSSVDEQAIASMAKEVTVVINGQNPGSGVIIAKQGNTYYVLTAKHVVATQDEYEIVTSDAIKHPLNYSTVQKFPGVDLALVQFTSNKNYRVAQLGSATNITEGATVYVSGWPHPGPAMTARIYQMTKGNVSGRPLATLEDGYELVYTNVTRSGMSGGPVLDTQGRVVGIHGRAEGEAIFNPDTGQTIDVKSGFNLAITINTFLKNATQTKINLVYLGDDFTLVNTLPDTKKVLSVAISPDGQIIASGLADGNIKLWNKNTGKELRVLAGHSSTIDSLAISPDGQTLVSGSRDKTIKIWNIQTGQLLHTLTETPGSIVSVAISPDGQMIAAGSVEDKVIRIWNLRSGKLLHSLSGHSYSIWSIAFCSDSQTLVSSSADKIIKIWDVNKGQLLRNLSGTLNVIRSLAVSPYGSTIASGTYSNKDVIGGESNTEDDATIKIWNRNTGELLRTLKGHTRTISALAIDPFGHILASGSYDGTIKIWNLHSGQLLHSLDVRDRKGIPAEVFSLAFSGDGQTLISGNIDGTVKIWQLTKP
ncbi:trypsin-like peptidase domain-containing protein [Phormidium sp. LEGE 05292]|uniref:WD40 domain-containing protein n=1 Tax=[Phormidium] sp. LEGE 05292 TaxID=767427 RepID=UPI001881E08B|nr:trypsin-like peptidase domain-containing protein [Phormidium sp. LEGE 05292]MBE9227182.1 trypsin-like peptidase domain-containing protein [Phormidium sp. LEGE 05292]